MSEDSHNPPPVTMVCTCELNSNRPLKVWRMAMTPTRKPCLIPTCVRMTSAGKKSSRYTAIHSSCRQGGVVTVRDRCRRAPPTVPSPAKC